MSAHHPPVYDRYILVYIDYDSIQRRPDDPTIDRDLLAKQYYKPSPDYALIRRTILDGRLVEAPS